MGRLVAQLNLGPKCEIASIVCGVRSWTKVERNRARATRVDAEKSLRDTFDLNFDVGRQSDVDSDHADARQIPVQTGNRELRLLHKIDAGFNSERSRWDDIDVFGYQRSLLCRRDAKARQHQRCSTKRQTQGFDQAKHLILESTDCSLSPRDPSTHFIVRAALIRH